MKLLLLLSSMFKTLSVEYHHIGGGVAPILGPSSLPVVVTQPDERHANRTASVLLQISTKVRILNNMVVNCFLLKKF